MADVALIGHPPGSFVSSGEVSGSAAHRRVVACGEGGRHGEAYVEVVGELAEVLDREVGRSIQLTGTQKARQLASMAVATQRRRVLGCPSHANSVLSPADPLLTPR